MAEEKKEALSAKSCVPCAGGVPPLTPAEQAPLLEQLDGWTVESGKKLVRDFSFNNFLLALEFTNKAGGIAEAEGHHPEITVGWGHARVEIWTHKIDGLTESDFVLAAKYDALVSD